MLKFIAFLAVALMTLTSILRNKDGIRRPLKTGMAAIAFLFGVGFSDAEIAIAVPPSSNQMTISYYHPGKFMASVLGSPWTIYLSGLITDDTAADLERFVKQNNVSAWSTVVLNSPGGSLYGGIELGRMIRKLGFNTDVGANTSGSQDMLSDTSGECYSSCTYAYLGGLFRYLKQDSRYGVHRFYTNNPAYGNMDNAQITSAQIVSYLREMGVDPDFFNLSTKAGRDEVYEPDRALLEKLSVVNDGWGRTSWSVESKGGRIYLKGERDTQYGINKFIIYCTQGEGVFLYMIFDPQGHQDEVLKMHAHSLVVGTKAQPIMPISAKIVNGWFNGAYHLTKAQLKNLLGAKSVGVTLQWAYDAPVFLGFNAMPFDDGVEKLPGIVNSCSR